MEELIGSKLLKEIENLKETFRLLEIKPHVYGFATNVFEVRVVAAPGEEIGINLKLMHSTKPTLFYSVDNDLYSLADSDNYKVNQEIEVEIIEILRLLKKDALIVGERKGRMAFVIPYRNTAKIVYQGRFTISMKEYESYDNLLAKSGFTPLK